MSLRVPTRSQERKIRETLTILVAADAWMLRSPAVLPSPSLGCPWTRRSESGLQRELGCTMDVRRRLAIPPIETRCICSSSRLTCLSLGLRIVEPHTEATCKFSINLSIQKKYTHRIQCYNCFRTKAQMFDLQYWDTRK